MTRCCGRCGGATARTITAGWWIKSAAVSKAGFPAVSIATDVIVGFPGESETQFQRTYDLLAELKLDMAHLARYSTRPGTLAARQMGDDVPEEEKMRRFRLLEDQQEGILSEINAQYLGRTVSVLFEEKVKARWRGRTETNKLVFVESEAELRGQVLEVKILWAGPWSMIGASNNFITHFRLQTGSVESPLA